MLDRRPGRLSAWRGGRQQHGRRQPAAWWLAGHRVQQRQQQQRRQCAWAKHAAGRRQRGLWAWRQRRRRPSPLDGGLPAAAAPADEQQLRRQHACIAQSAWVRAASAAVTTAAAAAAAAAPNAVRGLERGDVRCRGGASAMSLRLLPEHRFAYAVERTCTPARVVRFPRYGRRQHSQRAASSFQGRARIHGFAI